MNICFVTSRFPYPIIKGDTLRAYHQIKELSRNHRVHLIAAGESEVSEAARTEMQRFCTGIDIVPIGKARSFATIAARGLASRLPLQVLYFLSPELEACIARVLAAERFDVVHALTIRVAPAVLAAANVPVVFDFMDSFAANIATRRRHVNLLKRPVYDLEYARVSAYERAVSRQASGGAVIAELDRETIGNPDLAIIPNGVDTDAFAFYTGEREPQTLVFTGNMGYQPNIDAVLWFASECWPQLRRRRPELRFQIVGARPTPAVSALSRLPGVEVTGRVESIVPYLHRATIAVCPIRCGSGMQNKLLEAMAAGAPVVTTEFANRGIGATPGRELAVAEDAAALATAVLTLLDDPVLRLRQARAARIWIEATYGWSRHAAAFVAEYARAIERSRPIRLDPTG